MEVSEHTKKIMKEHKKTIWRVKELKIWLVSIATLASAGRCCNYTA